MISKDRFNLIARKYGNVASWAVWADEGEKPKSNIGDMKIFDNPNLLDQLNPDVVMVGLNFARNIEKEKFVNFHDKRSRAQDYKIRYAFRDTKYYGVYMTDIIKDFKQLVSGKVVAYLRNNPDFEKKNVDIFEQEIKDLGTSNPLIVAFGNDVYKILNRHFADRYRIVKVPHYSMRISPENYRRVVRGVLAGAGV